MSPIREYRSSIARHALQFLGKNNAPLLMVCGAHILLSMAAPILFDTLRHMRNGRYPFSIPGLAFHGYLAAVVLCVMVIAKKEGKAGIKKINQPQMFTRFFFTACLSACGDMLTMDSMKRLDPGTFTLIGKGFTIFVTVLGSRCFLGKHHTPDQYAIVAGLMLSTAYFCQAESRTGHVGDFDVSDWWIGLVERSLAVVLSSVAAVMQEGLLASEAKASFIVQQVWIGSGSMVVSLAAIRAQSGELSFASVFRGFNDWPTYVAVPLYITHAVVGALTVKLFGALTKALCVPLVLGGCYLYAIFFDGAPFEVSALLSFLVSTSLICAFAFSSARTDATTRTSFNVPLPFLSNSGKSKVIGLVPQKQHLFVDVEVGDAAAVHKESAEVRCDTSETSTTDTIDAIDGESP